ncbi:MAG: 2-hydroxy-3-oxopropionate reductase [Pelagibacterium sp. SCN 64-44]|nr:MAG: 2-hydroxy-3-oxopropionate reductase [Pelagibacterium sp. SCN 64-44]
MQIGFIGLGVMGHPMAGHLIAAGHEVHLYRVKERHADLIESGGKRCHSAAQVAESSDIVILMLPDTGDVQAVLFGEDGIEGHLAPGKLLIDMSSISPVATKQFARRLAERDVGYVDAPVSGGEVGARAASLSIMAGGSEADFARALPLFESMGKNITRVGNVGDGQTAKVANQIIVGLTIEAVAEALTFASAAGADPAKVREALMGGFASSRILEVHGDRMIKRTFDPGFRIRLHRKDLSLAIDAARELDLSLPNTAATQQLMNGAIGHDLGDRDHSALVVMVEKLSGR